MLILGTEVLSRGTAKDVLENISTVEDVHVRSNEFAQAPALAVPASSSVYATQREMAIARPEQCRYIGSGAATTCVIIAVWDPESQLGAVAHLDGSLTASTLESMLNAFKTTQSPQLHLVGAFDDDRGHSAQLLEEVVQRLLSSSCRLHLVTACVGHINTTTKDQMAYPKQQSLVLDLSSGSVAPASFESRGPLHELRLLRIFDRRRHGSYPNVVDEETGHFVITPFQYEPLPPRNIKFYVDLTDQDLLQMMSTSPHCEGPDFCDDMRDSLKYMLNQRQFPGSVALVFQCIDGRWDPVVSLQAAGKVRS